MRAAHINMTLNNPDVFNDIREAERKTNAVSLSVSRKTRQERKERSRVHGGTLTGQPTKDFC
jgi:hypothetical protein